MGIVVTSWFSFNLYNIVVLPAASSPSIRRRISFDPKILPITLEIWPPIVARKGELRVVGEVR